MLPVRSEMFGSKKKFSSIMITRWSFKLIAGILIAITGRFSQALQSFPPFGDEQTLNPHYGDSSQFVEHLGRLVKLRTSVSTYEAFPCTFNILRRNKTTEVTFKPDWYCFRGSCGQYKFELDQLAGSEFDSSLRTIILVPGYLSDSTVEWVDNVARGWLAIEDVNVIKVSWPSGNKYLYERAVSGTPIVARQITILLHHLAGMNGIQFTQPDFARRIQIVGHSLGAHIGAFVGQDLGGLVGRITGLDPAGVFFDQQPRGERLDSTDARLVDVIHTNGGKLSYANLAAYSVPSGVDWMASIVPGVNRVYSKIKSNVGEVYNRRTNTAWFGIDQQVGHLDYYANDGRVQPDCESYLHVCDHSRAYEIYEDFLIREYHLMKEFGPELRKHNRPLTFKADDYDSFFVGASVARDCRPMMEVGRESRKELGESMKRCSLPMDLISPIDELIEEYSSDYGLAGLFAHPTEPSNIRFYFSTRGQRPLIGNHLMLKIYPSVDLRYNWGPQCSIGAEVRLQEGRETKITLLKDQTKPVGIHGVVGGRLVYSAVFVAPTIRLMEASRYRSDPLSGDWSVQLLPTQIDLTVNSVGSTDSTLMAAAKKVWGYLNQKVGSSKCTMFLDTVEIIPLVNSERTFVGRYENSEVDRSEKEMSPTKKLSLRLVSVRNE